MFKLDKILVPIDFSDNSAVATSHVAALARQFHSQITLLHISEFPAGRSFGGSIGYGVTSFEAERAEHLARQKKRLDDFCAGDLAGLTVRRMVCSGDPANLIVQRSQEEGSDLIVISTHGYGTFRHFLLGSVTAKVLHDAACPVWTTTHPPSAAAEAPAQIGHVICAVSFGPQACEAIQWASGFAAQTGAKLTVCHTILDHPPCLPARYQFQWHEEAHWGASERLHNLLNDLGIDADVLVVSDGDIPKAISNAAKEQKAELLVIGRSSAGRSARPLGSHAYSVICHAQCPVVSV